MPNWCNNSVEIYHEDPAMIERVREAFNKGALLAEFIPIPKDLQIVAGSVGDPDEQKALSGTLVLMATLHRTSQVDCLWALTQHGLLLVRPMRS